jgi:alpha-ketoglutarate-dependent taurine dioxygenase
MLGTLSRLPAAFGVEVAGIDLEAPLAPEEQAEIGRLLDAHRLLLFRQPDLSPESHVRVVSAVGTVGLQPDG